MFGKIWKHRTDTLTGYCFFDIDGVLNTASDWRCELYKLRDELVYNLCTFCKDNHLVPVIISSWRLGFVSSLDPKNSPQIKRLEKKFADHGLTLKYKTPVIKGKARSYEIDRFLEYHSCDRYIIIDDDETEYNHIRPQNYFVESEKGFTKEDARAAGKCL